MDNLGSSIFCITISSKRSKDLAQGKARHLAMVMISIH